MKLLLTGFEPFRGSTVNPSEQVVHALASQNLDGVHMDTAILPVERDDGPAELIRAVQQFQPEAVLCLGESTRSVISVERVAINLLDYRIADNAGNEVVDEPIALDGPAAYFMTLPVRAIVEAIRAAGVPAELSLSAGSFLCNQIAYVLLHYLASNKMNIPAGFIHVPSLPEQAARSSSPMPSMSLEILVKAVTVAIQVIARQPAAM
jgi:pyroglutamyl-peptidase